MIVDCFPFFNEIDLLELRLRTLEGVVDRFVVCEAEFTHRGLPKPLYFSEGAERFAPWRERIVHLVCPGPASGDAWANEWAHRNYLMHAIAALDPDDVVLMGDCDELVDPETVLARLPERGEVLGYRQQLSIFYANLQRHERWTGTRAFRAGDAAALGSLSAVRQMQPHVLLDGGWHLTWLGGTAAVRRKLAAFAHAELDIDYLTDERRLGLALAVGIDLTGAPLRRVPLDGLPAPLRADPERWAPFICPPAPVTDRPSIDALLHAHGVFAYVPGDAARVAALADRPAAWLAAGAERFGAGWCGVWPSIDDLPAFGPGDWIVADALEQRGAGAVFAHAARRRCGLIVFARNARNLNVLAAVASGHPYPPGAALGWSTILAEAERAGLSFVRCDRVVDQSVFVPSFAFHDGMGFSFANLAFTSLTRNAALDLFSQAFIACFEGRDA